MIGKYRQDLVLQAIGLPRSTFNYWRKHLPSEEKMTLVEKMIQTIFKENDCNYGYRRIKLALVNNGYQVNHKKIRRIMKKYGLVCTSFTRRSRSYRSYKGLVGTLARNKIKRRFFSSVPKQKIFTDISEFHYIELNSEGIKTIKKSLSESFS